MAQEMTRYKFNKSKAYPSINTVKPHQIDIGFEWEIQTKCNYSALPRKEYYAVRERAYEYGFAITTLTAKFIEAYNFKTHGECMAGEFCSPVAHRLDTIKAIAKKLQRRASKEKYLSPDLCQMAGIHVHTSIKTKSASAHSGMFKKIILMLNRESSKDFVWAFSGRDKATTSGYKYQAVATCWDTGSDKARRYAYGDARGTGMVRLNSFSNQKTIEYRLFNGTSDRMQPALEFAHACTKFVSQQKGVDVPYLKDFKTWLFKQKGYKLLKSQPEWALVE